MAPSKITADLAIILMRPQIPENIGTVARAMHNCGLQDLRLVQPKHGWPHPGAIKPAAGGHSVLDRARVYETLPDALADLQVVFATSDRSRAITQTIYPPKPAMAKLQEYAMAGQKVGLLFGQERTGLENDEIAYADGLITIPLNPEYTSLNLAQAVLLLGYEWWQLCQEIPKTQTLHSASGDLATKEDFEAFFAQLTHELDRAGFLRVPHKRPIMVRNLRQMFLRIPLTAQEIRTLRGIISCLVDPYYKDRQGGKA